MKVIGLEEFGGPEVLTVLDVPEPHAGPGQVRILVKAAAVSPTDTVLRAGGQARGHLGLPVVPGMDAAGIIDEADQTSGWSVGDKVMAIALPLGGHRGRMHSIWWLLPMNGLTAVQTLEKLGLQPGQSLAVTGAAGTLGNT